MKVLLIVILLLLPTFKYYKMGRPTPKGIEKWVEMYEHDLAEEYMSFVGDTLWDYYISADDLTDYVGFTPLQLGMTFLPSEAIIHTRGVFEDYAIDSLPRWRRHSSKMVKGTVMHELTHVWINQILREMRYNQEYTSPEYRFFSIYSPRATIYGANFIEEGICEYVAHKMGDHIVGPLNELEKPYDWEGYDLKYRRAQEYVTPIIEAAPTIKEGIQLLMSRSPPTKGDITAYFGL